MTNLTKITAAFTSIIIFILSLFGMAGKSQNFRVTTYLIADRVTSEESLHSEDFDIITDVILFGCATFDQKGNVNLNKEHLENALGCLRDVIGDRNVKVHLNFLGPGAIQSHDTWEDTMKDLSAQHNLAFASGVLEQNIIDVLNKYDFDGVCFDYEYPSSRKDWKIFSDFLVNIDKMLGERLLTAAVSTDVNLSPKAAKAVDRVEAMFYDVFDKSGNHSTTKTTKSLVKFLTLRGIDKEKIDFGLPFYSRPTDKDAYWYDYSSYYDKLDENGYYHDEQLGKTFWFNTPDVIAEKTEFAINRGLGGVMIWHYSCDLPSSNEKSLLHAIDQTIQKTTADDYIGSIPC